MFSIDCPLICGQKNDECFEGFDGDLDIEYFLLYAVE